MSADVLRVMNIAAELVDAVEHAEAEALAAHEAGTCHLSEWSCSWCPDACDQ